MRSKKEAAMKIPRATMIKGRPGCYERVDAFTHEHIGWISDEEIKKIEKEKWTKAITEIERRRRRERKEISTR
jgi:hypothetical protein